MWQERQLFRSIDLGEDGSIPMEIRFLHNPDATGCYIVTAVGASLIYTYRDDVSMGVVIDRLQSKNLANKTLIFSLI